MYKDMLKKNFMIRYMILFSLLVYIIGILLVRNKTSWTLGILFGLIFSVLKLKLMENTIKKAVQMPAAKAQTYTNVQYLIRYLLTAVVLAVAALEPSIDLLGVFFALFSMKAAAYMQIWEQKRIKKATTNK